MPEAATRSCAVGAERRGIDGAEHSAMLIGVMAGCAPFVDTVVSLSLRQMLTEFCSMTSTQTQAAFEPRMELEELLVSRARLHDGPDRNLPVDLDDILPPALQPSHAGRVAAARRRVGSVAGRSLREPHDENRQRLGVA